MKISDKLENFKVQGKTFYSFEYFPPKTDFGLDNLYTRIDRMASLQPAYIDITWGADAVSYTHLRAHETLRYIV